MKILNVAEKNDAAKSIAALLSRGSANKREGMSKFNKIYEFPYQYQNRPVQMIMTSVSGHLMEFAFPPAYKNWSSIDPVVLFDAPIKKSVSENFLNIKNTLIKEVRQAQVLIIWTDCDREGENIGMEIVDVCREVKPNITVLRAQFSEITQQAVTRAMNNLVEIDEKVSEAVDVRQELDLRIGASFTRLQTLRLRKAFPTSLESNLISYGPCQFPTLGFVVERFREVDQFIPEKFWKLSLTIDREEIKNEFYWSKGNIFDKDICEAFLSVIQENPNGFIYNVVKKSKSRWRPTAMDTVELEKLASTKLRLTAKETMSIAEKLYTQGFISYPRTETNIFPKEMNLKNIVNEQTGDSRWASFAQRVLSRGVNPRNGKKSDKAHPPIHPLKLGSGLQGNEGRVFELITRHFLACVSEDAKAAETHVSLIAGIPRNTRPELINEEMGELFECKGLSIIEKNYLEVYSYEKWTDKIISDFQRGEWFYQINIEMRESSTRAPPLLTEAELISLMDKHGIGTDATHAEHIETIKKRLYVGLDDKFLVPGQIGMGLIEGYDSMDLELSKPNLRAKMENDLKLICEGFRTGSDVLNEYRNHYKALYKEICRKIELMDQCVGNRIEVQPLLVNEPISSGGTNPSISKCPLCNESDIIFRRRKNNNDSNDNSFYVSCLGYPNCKFAIWLPKSIQNVNTSEDRCPRCTRFMANIIFPPNTRLPSGSITMPDEEIKICLFCNQDFREAFEIRIPHFHGNNSGTQIPPPTQQTQPQQSLNSNNITNSTLDYSSRHENQTLLQRSTPSLPSSHSQARSLESSFNTMRNEFGNDRSGNPQPSGSGNVNCFCAVPSVQRVVRKEGPNTGRKFFSCGEMTGQNCNFFQWADEEPGSDQHDTNGGSNRNMAARNQSAPHCSCGAQAKMRTVQKESANKGRNFYSCPNRTGQNSNTGCDFFEWADGNNSSNTFNDNNGTMSSNRPKLLKQNSMHAMGSNSSTVNWPPMQISSDSRTNSVKRCGICRQPGHTRNKCPQRD